MTRTAFSLAVVVLVAPQLRAQAHPPQPAQHGANPTVSPDGRRIAFVSDRSGTGDLYVMNVDGSNVRRLTTDGGHKGRAYWSADGRALVFSVSANDTAHVYSLPPEGGAPAEIAKFAARTGAIRFPDGAHFLFGIGPWSEVHLVTARADGSDRVQLTADHATYFCPAISPQGGRIVATRFDSSGSQIWVMNADASGARAVTHLGEGQDRLQCAAFSPSGQRLAVQGEHLDPRDTTVSIGHIWVVNLATGDATRLAEHLAPYHDELPTWFPDGKHIAFQSDRTGPWEIWVMNADGTDARQLTR